MYSFPKLERYIVTNYDVEMPSEVEVCVKEYWEALNIPLTNYIISIKKIYIIMLAKLFSTNYVSDKILPIFGEGGLYEI